MLDPWRNLLSLNKDKCLNLQGAKLHQFINRQVYPFSAQYRRVFDKIGIDPKTIRSVNDLARLPLTSKRDFNAVGDKEPFREFILTPDKEKLKKCASPFRLAHMVITRMFKGEKALQYKLSEEYRPCFMTFTTGTTSKPVPFGYTNYDIKNLYLSGARMLEIFDVAENERIVNCFPFAPHLAFWQVVFGGLSANTLVLSTGGGKSIGTEGNISALEKMRPALVLGVPGYVYHVLRVAQEKGCRMDYIKKIVLGASRVTMGFKRKITELLESMGAKDIHVFGTYGFTEARCAWAECPTSLDVSSGYHLYPDKEIFEVIDPESGEVKGEGEDGELVYTSLDARASVVLRFRTGDYVKGGITYAPCPHCGRTVPRISSDITRLSNVKDLNLSKVKGALVNFNNFEAAMSEVKDLNEWQLEIRKKDNDPFEVDELVVYAHPKTSYNEDQLRKEIGKQLLFMCEVTPNEVNFVSMDEMVRRLELETANKEKRIVDNRPKEE